MEWPFNMDAGAIYHRSGEPENRDSGNPEIGDFFSDFFISIESIRGLIEGGGGGENWVKGAEPRREGGAMDPSIEILG